MIYLDNAATARPDGAAVEQASVYLTERFFNPSAKYKESVKLTAELTSARDTVKAALGSSAGKVIFTASGSEADNTAIFCHTGKGKCVTTEGEHAAVLSSFAELKRRGVPTDFAKIDAHGKVNVDDFLSKIDRDTAFVSVMHVNNETGAINDVNKIAQEVKKIAPDCVFHSDGVQAFCKIETHLDGAIDLYSVSAHKIGALKGTGALYVSDKTSVSPLVFGGGQEGGLRSGTENVFGIRCMQFAVEARQKTLIEQAARLAAVKRRAAEYLEQNDFLIISGEDSSPYILSVSAGPVRGEVLLHMLEEAGVLVGTGSACSSKNRFSHVVKACGYADGVADGVLRLSFSYQTTENEVLTATDKLVECANKLKKIMRVTKWKK